MQLFFVEYEPNQLRLERLRRMVHGDWMQYDDRYPFFWAFNFDLDTKVSEQTATEMAEMGDIGPCGIRVIKGTIPGDWPTPEDESAASERKKAEDEIQSRACATYNETLRRGPITGPNFLYDLLGLGPPMVGGVRLRRGTDDAQLAELVMSNFLGL